MRLFIPGVPKPGGSKTAMLHRHTGRIIVKDASRNEDWKASIRLFAHESIGDNMISGRPIALHIVFQMPRPKHHYNSKGILKSSAPKWHTSKPDATKLLRCLEDSLTGVAWDDDSRIVDQHVQKVYADKPGAWVEVDEVCP